MCLKIIIYILFLLFLLLFHLPFLPFWWILCRIGSGKSFFGIGPYLGFGLNATSNSGEINLYERDKIRGESYMHRWNFGGGAILGYEFANGVIVDASFRTCFSNMLNINENDAIMRNWVFSFGLGYRFQLFILKLDKDKIYESIF
jgi:hypothetical protein